MIEECCATQLGAFRKDEMFPNRPSSYAIRVAKRDVYEVERQYSKQLAEWCVDKWNLKFPNLQKVIQEDIMKQGQRFTVLGNLSSNLVANRRTSVASQINEQASIKKINSSFTASATLEPKPNPVLPYLSPQWDPKIPVIQPE